MEWSEVIAQPDFQDLNSTEQGLVRERWIKDVYTPKLQALSIPQEDVQGLQQEALESYDNGQGYVSSLAGSIGRGFGSIAPGVAKGIGVLSQDPILEEGANRMQQGLEDAMGANPSLGKTNFTGEAAGNALGILATGSLGALAGAARGGEAAMLGAGFLQGVAGGADEADQYGLEGDQRLIRAIGGGLLEAASEKIPFGMGTETRALSRIPGIGGAVERAAGSQIGQFAGDVTTEGLEEVASQMGGNLLTQSMTVDGAPAPTAFQGTGEAFLGGAIGGGIFGALNLRPRSEMIASDAAATAEAAGDVEAAAVINEAAALSADRPPMVPVQAPVIEETPDVTDSTVSDPLEMATPGNLGLPDEIVEQVMPQEEFTPPVEEIVPEEQLESEILPADAPVSEIPAVEEPAVVEEVPTVEVPLEQQIPVPELTPEQVQVFNPQGRTLPKVQLVMSEQDLKRKNEYDPLIDVHGRISEPEAVKIFKVFKDLGITNAELSINDTGAKPGLSGDYYGSRSIVDGKDTVFLNKSRMRQDTPVHEVIGHGALNQMQASHPDLYQRGVELFTGSKLYEAIEDRYAASKKPLTGQKLMEEVMATAYANDNANFWKDFSNDSAVVQQIRQWLAQAREWVSALLTSRGVDPNMSIKDFHDKVNQLLLSGNLKEFVPYDPNGYVVLEKPFSEMLLESLPEQSRAAWTEEDLQAADDYASGDTAALERIQSPIRRARVERFLGNLEDGQDFSLPTPGQQKPSGLSASQTGPVRQMAANMTYGAETMDAAMDQAIRLYSTNVNQGMPFDGHLSYLQDLFNRTGQFFNLTPGAYFGLLSRDLTEVEMDPSAPESDRAAARANNDRLVGVISAIAASGGQMIKGIDGGLRIANNPRMVVDGADRLAPFNGQQRKRDAFDGEKAVVNAELSTFTTEVLATTPAEALTSSVEQGMADVVRGDEAAIAGETELEASKEPDIQELEAQAAITEDPLFQQGFSLLNESLQGRVNEMLEWIALIAYADQQTTEGDFSLATPDERNAAVRARFEAMRQQGMSKESIIAAAKKRVAELERSVRTRRTRKVSTTPAGTPEELQEMVVTRLQSALDKLINPPKKGDSKMTQDKIAAAITSALLAKAGMQTVNVKDPDSMALALGLLFANQETAANAVQDVHNILQNDEATKDAITLEKLKAFMQLAIGKSFNTPNGANQEAQPYGEAQVAAVLRGEMNRLNINLSDVVMDSSLSRATADQLEASLRDPARGFTKLLSAADLDKVVSAVRQEYSRTAAERARRIQADVDQRESDASVRDAARESRDKRRETIRQKRLERKAQRKARRDAKQLPDALNYEEAEALLKVPGEKVIDYLARQFGFDVSQAVELARASDRYATLEQMTLTLADALGLTQAQAQKFVQPVIAQAMKLTDTKRKKEVERRVNEKVQRISGRRPQSKPGQTEAQKLIKLAELGALTDDNIEKVMLNSIGATKFSDSFRQELMDVIARANDASLPQASRDQFYAQYLGMIRSARGSSAIGLLGEWIMSNIFFSLNTFKVNAVWGGIKAVADTAIYAGFVAPKAIREAGGDSKGVTKTLIRQALRGYSHDLQYQRNYIFRTGKSKLESDYTTQFSNSDFELLAQFPDTEIRAWIDGKPLSKPWQKGAKALARMNKYVRRTMVGTDLWHRNQAYEMLKATQIMKTIVEQGNRPKSAAEWAKAIDDGLYGGSFDAAKERAKKQVADEIAGGQVQEPERGIRFGEIMDSYLGQSLGVPEGEQARILEQAVERAKRWTVAEKTEGILGLISNTILAMVRDIPGLKFLLPAVRMPIGAFSQGLDWSPYGYLREQAIKWNQGKSSSVTNYIFNRDGIRKNWNLPASGVDSERAIELRNKAHFGTTVMIGLLIAAAVGFDDDEDEADFYITGKGPENPAENKLWREKGYRPFMVRVNGVSANFQESPIYPMLAVLGAWSDSNRYGKPDETTTERLAYAFTKSMSGFADAAVLKNLTDALGTVTGGSGYSSSSGVENTMKWTSRTAGVLIAPRVGSEINTILFGPQDQKQIGWSGRALANVPFVPALFNKPALNFFGEELHTVRGDAWGEVAPMLAHRIGPLLTDDPQLQLVAKFGANPMTTTMRKLDATEVKDDYELMRAWSADSGKALRTWLTPDRISYFNQFRARDEEKATEEFDKEVRRIRQESLRRVGVGKIRF